VFGKSTCQVISKQVLLNETMKLKITGFIFLLVFSAIFLLVNPCNVYAASISVSGKAKVLNTDNGYLNFTLYNSNVKVDDGTGVFSGYAWLEDMGWVAFGTADNTDGPVTLNLTTGAVTGKAKVLNTGGFLYFTTNNSNVTVALSTGIFSGHVWSEDVGWIDFTDTGVSSASFLPTAPTTNNSNSSSNNSTSTSTACSDQAPGAKAPWLYGAIAQDSGSVLLYFTEADNPINKYVLEYGTKSGDYPYGVQDMGVNSRGQMTFLVNSLSSNTTYYFKVRGGNGCATGTWSNEISAKTKGLVTINNLDFVSSELMPVEETQQAETNLSCQNYTVKTGWELKINCGKQATTETQTPEGYDVKVKVVDTEKKPVEGAKVTIHSKVQETITNKDGIAEFKNVEVGDHKVLIAYNNFEGEQAINLTGNVKEFVLNVTVQEKAIALSPLAYAIIGIMGLVIIGLIVLLLKNKRKV
jgi:hypothetical protein